MEITEVRIKLMDDPDDRLQAFCSITFDNCFVVRDLKIIEGTNGPFVAMPSRKLTSHCTHCGCKNHLRALYCNHCGSRQAEEPRIREEEGRAKLYADIAHPINSQCREMIQEKVISEYRSEQQLSQQPGYVSRYDEDFDDEFEGGRAGPTSTARPSGEKASGENRTIDPKASQQCPPPHCGGGSASLGKTSADRPVSRRRNDDFGAGIF